jgi:penicillin-binding protein 1A
MPMPSNVVPVDGELYFDAFLPGEGFVSTVDVPAEAEPEAGELQETASGLGAEPVLPREAVTEGQRATNILEGR